MALKKAKRYVVDNDGFVMEERTWREKAKAILSGLFEVMYHIVVAVFSDIKKNWDEMGKLPKLASREKIRADDYKAARDSMPGIVLFFLIALVALKKDIISLLWFVTATVELLSVLAEAVCLREAIRRDDDELIKDSSKIASRLLTAFMIMMFIATIFSWLALDGKLGSFTEYFPVLQDFAEWWVSQVNDALEVFKKIGRK